MLSKITSGALVGVDGYKVDVEVDVSKGLPSFDIVGLPDSAVKESKERVRTAIANCGYPFPAKRITVNLAPADTRKEGPAFDLPMAVGVLTGMGVIKAGSADGVFVSGELSLDGAIRPVDGVLSMVHHMAQIGLKQCIVPPGNAREAALVDGVSVVAAPGLSDVIRHLNGQPLPAVTADSTAYFHIQSHYPVDFADVRGQENGKRALEIAAAGGHNVLMIGPPGTGKTMMAHRVPTILPDLTFAESIEVTKIYSVAGLLKDNNGLVTERPYRTPHHTISYAALTGGGRVPKPGEISLAHNGVLFLDELPEFNKNVLEVLRQPMEDGSVTISRVNGTMTYPAGFMLIASMNPCPCGHYGNRNKCNCTQGEISRYLAKVSGPLLDRIDIQVEVPAMQSDELVCVSSAESSSNIKKRVLAAIDMQRERFSQTIPNEETNSSPTRFNAQMTMKELEAHCALGESEQRVLKKAFDQLGLSGRAYHKILKVARTIADLDKSDRLTVTHLAEAIQYRSLDRKYWGA